MRYAIATMRVRKAGETMNERLKKIRKAIDLTQQEFAERIGSVQNTITGYEAGRRTPSNAVINSICREFNVNEEWLRTGTGDMFVQLAKDEQIAKFTGEILSNESNSFKRRLISMLAALDESEWNILEQIVLKMQKD